MAMGHSRSIQMTSNIKIEDGQLIFPSFRVAYKSMYTSGNRWTEASLIGYVRGVIDAMWYLNNITADERIDALSQVTSEIEKFIREYR
jgi:hypothetical protein